MKFEIERDEENIIIIRLAGELIEGEILPLKKEFEKLLAENLTKFIIDFSALNFIDSSGIGFLINLKKIISAKDGTLKFTMVNQNIKSILNTLKLTPFFDMYKSIDEAIFSF